MFFYFKFSFEIVFEFCLELGLEFDLDYCMYNDYYWELERLYDAWLRGCGIDYDTL